MHTIPFRSILFRFLIALVCIALLGQGIVVRPALAKKADAPSYLQFSYRKPVSVSWSNPQKSFVFVIARDGTVWTRALNGGSLTWDSWVWLAAPPVSGRKFIKITASSWTPGRIDLVGMDDYRNVWHKYAVNNGSSVVWYPTGTWEDLGNPEVGAGLKAGPLDGIQMVSWGSDRLDIFVQYIQHCDSWGGCTSPGAVIWKSWDSYNGGWSSWTSAGQSNDVYPWENLTTWGVNRLDRIAVDWHGPTSCSISHRYWNGSSWRPTAWEDLGSAFQCEVAPYSVSWGSNRLSIFARDMNYNVKYKAWTGSSWTGWTNIGGDTSGNIYAPVTGVSRAANRIDVFEVRGGSAPGVYHKGYSNGTWSPSLTGWEYIGGEAALSDISATSWGSSRIDLFAVRSGDGSLWHLAWNGSTWTPSINSWEYIGN